MNMILEFAETAKLELAVVFLKNQMQIFSNIFLNNKFLNNNSTKLFIKAQIYKSISSKQSRSVEAISVAIFFASF